LGGAMSLFEELKRRNVTRVALLYTVASWLILQVADLLFEALELPTSWMRLVIALLLLGFPLALIFSWLFEVTPEGIRRESDIDRDRPASPDAVRKTNYLIIGLLAVAITVLLADRFFPDKLSAPLEQGASMKGDAKFETTDKTNDENPSIAVLPFENFSDDKKDEYFSDGLSDTVLHQLAQIPGLRVIARNSSFQFKGSNLDVREVGKRLGVANILEGSVQRYGDQVRVIAQLVRSEDGSHIWSQSFDYRMDDIFALHDAIARSVTEQMKIALLSSTEVSLALGGTQNPRAYDLRLQALGAFRTTFNPTLADQVAPDEFPAMHLLDQSLAVDPDYVDAMVEKVEIYNMFAFQTTKMEIVRESIAKASPIVEQALELAPAYSRAWSAKGFIDHRSGNGKEAMAAFRKAIELNPNDASAHRGLAVASIVTAPLDTLEHMRIMRELDPENRFNRPTVMALTSLNRTDEAVRTLQSDISGMTGMDQMIFSDLADIFYGALGLPDESARWSARLLAIQPDSPRGITAMARAWLAAGDADRAAAWLSRAQASDSGSFLQQSMQIRVDLARGETGAAKQLLAEITATPAPGMRDALVAELQARVCIALAEADCSRIALNILAESAALARTQAEIPAWWEGNYKLLQATRDALAGSSPAASAEDAARILRESPMTTWNVHQKTLGLAEANVLLENNEQAIEKLNGSLLPDQGYLGFDSFHLAADQGLVLSRLNGTPAFEEWKLQVQTRRQAALERMLALESAGEIPAAGIQ
jgi:TolB-like protein/tetratricopeptide (TPR) repeat protein